MTKTSFFKRITAALLCLCMSFCLASCEKEKEQENGFDMDFSLVNVRGNTNGNIANMGLGVKQGEWILFTDMGDNCYLKASKNYGKDCIVLMEDLQDILACINLEGKYLDYISSVYGDINRIDLEGGFATPLISSSSYCLQSVYNMHYFIDESGDGRIYSYDDNSGIKTPIGSHAAFVSGVTDENRHASFSVSNECLYYCAADDSNRIYRVDLPTGEEVRLCGRSARMLIAEGNCVLFVDANNDLLYRVEKDGSVKKLTDHGVGTFNFDANYIYYTDSSVEGKPLMRMDLSGENKIKLCNEKDTMYINILGEMLMLYCVDSDGNGARTVFVSKNGGETYTPS